MYRLIVFLFILLISCSLPKDKNKTRARVEMLFQNELNKENVDNVLLKVYSPSHDIDWNFAGGKFTDGREVTADNPFYCASIGKMFTATAIAQLKEQGKLRFQDKIIHYLPEDIMQNLHVHKGTDYSDEITIAQLLQHTSGLPDYFEGKTTDGSPNAMQLIFSDTVRFWTPEEMIALAKEKMKPLFPPGTGYSYSDTEYVLLGLIIENVSGLRLHDFLRENIFKPCGMTHTYLNLRSEPIEETGKMTEFSVGDYHVGKMTSLSADWAAGGLISSTDDLIRFYTDLQSGKIVSETTLEEMKDWVAETHGMYYGFGLRKIVFSELFHILQGIHVEGHSGTTGSFLYYCPQLDVYLAGTLNQTEEVRNSVLLMAKIFSILKHEGESASS